MAQRTGTGVGDGDLHVINVVSAVIQRRLEVRGTEEGEHPERIDGEKGPIDTALGVDQTGALTMSIIGRLYVDHRCLILRRTNSSSTDNRRRFVDVGDGDGDVLHVAQRTGTGVGDGDLHVINVVSAGIGRRLEIGGDEEGENPAVGIDREQGLIGAAAKRIDQAGAFTVGVVGGLDVGHFFFLSVTVTAMSCTSLNGPEPESVTVTCTS